MKPKASCSGYVDGAWWPRSDDLTAELPEVIAVLAFRLGPVDRMIYRLGEWTSAPTELVASGRAIRLDGRDRHPPNTVEVYDSSPVDNLLDLSEQARHNTTAAAAHERWGLTGKTESDVR